MSGRLLTSIVILGGATGAFAYSHKWPLVQTALVSMTVGLVIGVAWNWWVER